MPQIKSYKKVIKNYKAEIEYLKKQRQIEKEQFEIHCNSVADDHKKEKKNLDDEIGRLMNKLCKCNDRK